MIDSSRDTVLINLARRAVVIPHRLGACLVTGTDKLRSGFGNGDCLLLDFSNLVFAVSDAAERFPSASRSLLSRLGESLAEHGAPKTREQWLELTNALYARQSYHHKTTFSCVAIDRKRKSATAYVIHGGDSIVLLINLKTKTVDYGTSANMHFAGRSTELVCVDEISIDDTDHGFVIASDGIADTARLSGRTLERICGSVLSRLPLHEIPEGLAGYLDELPPRAEYDDIGIIAFSPTHLEREDHATLLIGGTTPAEEAAFQRRLSEGVIDATWAPLSNLVSEPILRL